MADTLANTKIAELIQTTSGYSAQVDLKLWFSDSAKNLATMRRYKPTISHRRAFEQVTPALDSKDKRVYLITGNYGTGKSHLCLMLANYFAYPASQPEIAQFLSNYAKEDEDAANRLRARRQKGRYLVAMCDFGSTDDFDVVVLRAVLAALEDAGLSDALQTPYNEAHRKLAQLEAEHETGESLVDFFGLFEKQLPLYMAGTTMKAFKKKLYPGMDRTALDAFKRMYQDILRAPFTYEASNLSAILQSTLASPAFQDAYQGIVVFWDEFGYTLANPNRLSINVFHQFAQLCTEYDPSRGKLIFIATAHKDFSAYAPAWAAADYAKLSDRVTRVNLLPEGLEDVVGAIVSPNREHTLWQDAVLPQAKSIWSQWVPACKNSGAFEWLVGKPPLFRSKILEGVYPMHPMATYAVIKLAQEVASQNRTVVTFFSSEREDDFEEGSYLWYIHNFSILDAAGNLNFYTADRLFGYFRARLNTANPDVTPKAKERIGNYEAALTQLQRARNQNPLELAEITLIERILRLMLIYDLVGVHTSLENLAFGLNMRPGDKKALENQMTELGAHSVVHRNPATKLYEFRRSDLFDVDQAIEGYKHDHADELGNLAVELNELVPLKKGQYMEAKAYNAQYYEDKRMVRRIVTPADLGTTRTVDGTTSTYFDLLEEEVDKEVARRGDFEGIILYVLCESQTDMSTARNLAAKNKSRRIVVAIPTAPIAFKEAILNLRAIKEIERSPQAENFSTQDNALVVQRRKDFVKALEALRDQLLDPRKLTWLGAFGNTLPVEQQKPDDAATRVMQPLYTRRSTVRHDDFNLNHDVRSFSKPHLALVEAVNALLEFGPELRIDAKQPDNRGEVRYLHRCLYQHGVLQTIRQVGSVAFVQTERNLAKFEPSLPALADMIRDIETLGEADRLLLRTFLNKYRQHPYGLGDIALALLFATVLRFFGDTIKIKKDDTAIGDLFISNFDVVADIVKGNYPDAFIKYREIRPGEREMIRGVYCLFADSPSAVEEGITVTHAYDAVDKWYAAIPPVSRVVDFYKGAEHAGALQVLDVLEKLHALDPHAIVLGELQTVAGYDASEMLTPERAKQVLDVLKNAKEQIEACQEHVQSQIRNGLCQVFGVEGNTWDDVADGVRAWYNGLDSNQRSTTAPWHNEASKPLVQLFVDLSDPRQTFLEKLPERPSYNFKRVHNWNANLVKDYLAKIAEGVKHIEGNRIKVPSPEVKLVGEHQQQGSDVSFAGPLTLQLSHPGPDVRVFVTDTGEDPPRAKERNEFRETMSIDVHQLVQKRQASVTIKYAPQDAEGNWGIVGVLTFIDETLENVIRLPKELFRDTKRVVKFVFPKTAPGVATSCRTLLESILENEVVERGRLRQLVQEILDDLAPQEPE